MIAGDRRDWVAREEEARRLGAGPDDAATTRRLVRAAQDPEPEVRKDDEEWEVRWAAARSLGAAASRSARVRAALERATGDRDPAVAEAARAARSAAGA